MSTSNGLTSTTDSGTHHSKSVHLTTAGNPVAEAPTKTFLPPVDADKQTARVANAGIENDLDPVQQLPQIPGYELLKVIGRGGMGTVYQALQVQLQRHVALKLISAPWASDATFRARFVREVTTLAALDHENIIPIYDAGIWQGLPYLTMKLVTGKTLHQHIDALRSDLLAAARILVQVARAVHHVHEKGIVHRDLKPPNILLTPEGKPLVADFGLARSMDNNSDLSLTLVPLGTRQYMSPEQTRGGKANYTPACDIWALGIILYELLTGRRPFVHDDTVELFQQIRHDPLPPIPTERHVPTGLAAIMQKCLQKEPANRYATAAELADDLERWLAGNQPQAIYTPAITHPATTGDDAASREFPQLTTRETSRSVTSTQRWLRRRGLVYALVIVGGVIAGGMAAWRQWAAPEPQPGKSPAERFAQGEKITLIGEKGMPQVASVALSGCVGTLTESREGYATLTCAGVTLIELWNRPTAQPIRLRAEYAITEARDLFSTAGVYVAGKTEWGGERPWYSAVVFGHSTEHIRDLEGKAQIHERFGFCLYSWHHTPPGIDFCMPQNSRVLDAPNVNDRKPVWRTVEAVIRPEVLEATYEGLPVPPLLAHRDPNQPRVLSIEVAVAGVGAEPGFSVFKPPYIGPGIGVFVNNAEAIFRNCTIEPIEK